MSPLCHLSLVLKPGDSRNLCEAFRGDLRRVLAVDDKSFTEGRFGVSDVILEGRKQKADGFVFPSASVVSIDIEPSRRGLP